jgi:ribosome maturation factor RimP
MTTYEKDLLLQTTRGILQDKDFRLYDFDFNEVAKVLRVYIDKESGVTISDCQKISSALSQELDKLDLIKFKYILEVSSPGINRLLKRPEHFRWALGKQVEIDLADMKVRGFLRDVDDNGILVALPTGEKTIPFPAITRAKVLEEINYDKRR